MIIEDELIIDLSKINKFDDSHLRIVNEMKDVFIKWWPELFGKNLPPQILFDGFEIVPNILVDFTLQKYKVGSSHSETDLIELGNDMDANGFKLRNPLPAWFMWEGNSMEVITGNGRGKVLDGRFGITNSLVAIYKPAPGYTKDEIEDVLEDLGGSFNTIEGPRTLLSIEDAKRLMENSCDRFSFTDGKSGTDFEDRDAMIAKLNRICGNGRFTEETKTRLVDAIRNELADRKTIALSSEEKNKVMSSLGVIISWASTGKKAAFTMKKFKEHNKLVDTDKVVYVDMSYTAPETGLFKSINKAADLLRQGKRNFCVRAIIHSGTLNGLDLPNVYKNRLVKFYKKWYQLIDNVCQATGGNVSELLKYIELYCATPAIGREHNLYVPVFFDVSKKETLCQYSSPTVDKKPFFYDFSSSSKLKVEIEKCKWLERKLKLVA